MPGSTKVPTERLRDVLVAVATASSDLSFDGLLERILCRTGDLVDARRGFLDVLDPRSERRMGRSAAFGIGEADAPRRTGRELLVELMEQHGAATSARIATGDDLVPFIGVPIRIRDELFGNMYLADKRSGGGFSREDEEVALAIASAAGVVIENARLSEQTARQHRWVAAAADITTALLGPISRDRALQLVADRARDVAAADFVALLMPAGGTTFIVEAVSGMPGDGVLGEKVDTEHSVAGEAARSRTTVVVPDTSSEPRYQHHKTPAWPNLGSLMALPLRAGDDTGALVVGWLRGHQTDRWELDPALPQRFADQAALVLQVVRAQIDQGRLAVFEDRDRIGRDLHDLVIQRLFAIGLMLDNTTKLSQTPEVATRLSSAIDEIDQTIKDIRRTIFALSAAASSADLRTELSQVVDHSAALLGFRPELRVTGPVDSVVTEGVREHLVAVVGEALSNVVRHADARHVVVELDVDHDIQLMISDDGQGLGGRPSGTGLGNMRHRAELLGGRCEVSSRPAGGVRIRWDVPRWSA